MVTAISKKSCFKNILFDLDNTLLDFDTSSRVAFQKVLKTILPHSQFSSVFATFTSVSHKLWRRFEKGDIDRSFLKLERFRATFEQHGIETDPVAFGASYLEDVCRSVFFIENALEVCQAIRCDHIKMGIVTNGISDVQSKRLYASGLMPFFDFVVCSDSQNRPKPFPDLFASAWHQMGNPKKSEVLMIGDNVVCDVLGAKNFGFQTAWYNPHQVEKPHDIHPDFILNNLEDVLSLCEISSSSSQRC